MKITRLQSQAKRPDRVSVYVDGKYSFSLAKDQIAELGLEVEQTIDPEAVKRYLSDSHFGKLRDRTYRWLAIRLRSEWEIHTYLDRRTDDETIKKKLFKLLQEQGYVDDSRFAAAWIRHRNLIKPMSKLRLKQELRQKRLPPEIIDVQLEEQSSNDAAAIKQLIAKRGHRYPDKQKLMAYLARQGFNYGDIKAALTDE